MDDKKKQAIHKQAVLEFLYATAAQAIAQCALVAVEQDGDHAKADKMLACPLTRNDFMAGVEEELTGIKGVPIKDAPTPLLVAAAGNVSKRLAKLARGTARPVCKVPVVELAAGGVVPVLPKSNDFGAN